MLNHALLALLVCAGAPALGAGQPPDGGQASAAPSRDEVIVYSDRGFQGDSMTIRVGDKLPDLEKSEAGNWARRISSLKIGEDAVIVLYSSPKFQRFCLGIPGKSAGGSGFVPDLSAVKNPSLRMSLDDNVRSLRVVGSDAELATLCRPLPKGER
jgi:hypothetical protein